jgi:hypothetical protein
MGFSLKEKQHGDILSFSFTFRNVDNVLSLIIFKFGDYSDRIYTAKEIKRWFQSSKCDLSGGSDVWVGGVVARFQQDLHIDNLMIRYSRAYIPITMSLVEGCC